jgi:hypothetical protein
LLSNVTDGFGVSNSPTYISTSWGSYNYGATTNYPVQESGPRARGCKGQRRQMGSEVSLIEPISTLERARMPRGGSQSVFRDSTRPIVGTNLITRSYFEQIFPLVGMLSQRELLQSNALTPIARVVITNVPFQLDANASNERYFRYSSGSTATRFEFGGTWNGTF